MAAGGTGNALKKEAIELLQKAAKNEKVQAAAVLPATKAMAWTAKKTGDAVSRPVQLYQHRRMAVDHALQVQGRYSRRTIVLGTRRYVVWKDGSAVACYPPMTPEELNGRTLEQLPELQDFNPELLVDPKLG
jgi:hypothetical protein